MSVYGAASPFTSEKRRRIPELRKSVGLLIVAPPRCLTSIGLISSCGTLPTHQNGTPAASDKGGCGSSGRGTTSGRLVFTPGNVIVWNPWMRHVIDWPARIVTSEGKKAGVSAWRLTRTTLTREGGPAWTTIGGRRLTVSARAGIAVAASANKRSAASAASLETLITLPPRRRISKHATPPPLEQLQRSSTDLDLVCALTSSAH